MGSSLIRVLGAVGKISMSFISSCSFSLFIKGKCTEEVFCQLHASLKSDKLRLMSFIKNMKL